MKKNKMMRLAAILLVCVLMTTSVISGTFAKYTTSATVTDKARVAYWGFGKAEAVTFDLFSASYDSEHVKSADGDNVIAPGTKQSTDFAFKYTSNNNDQITAPEVHYEFKVEATIEGKYEELDKNPNFYWTLKAANATEATRYDSVEKLIAAIELLSGEADGTCEYAPGKLPAAFTGNEGAPSGTQLVTIGWVWDFDTNDDPNTTDKNEEADQDAFDTAMGNMDPLENVEITIVITATQVD